MMEVLNSCVKAQKFLRSFPPLESKLLSLLTPCRTMRLLDQVVATRCRNHLLVVDIDQARQFPDCGTIASQLIGVNGLWDIVFSQQPGQEGLRRFGVSMPLKENIEHEAVLVHCAPQPMPNAVDARADFIQIPAGTPPGFPLAQFFRKQGTEFDAPLPERLVTDLDTALVESFLNVSVAQGEAVIEPDGVLDDTHRKAVAVGLDVSHGGSAYPGTIKATQPREHLGQM